MKKHYSCLLGCLVALCGLVASAQKVPLSVNHLTGTATVNIPITSLSNGNVNVPVSIVYSATGVRVKDVEGKAGIGWQLNAGGQVSRQVRGLPDDVNSDSRQGWLYTSNGAAINSFTIANIGTCTTENTDVGYINAHFAAPNDNEPDIFYVNAPGLSCQLVFDASHVPHTLSKEDIKVTYTTDGGTGLITSFKIINDKGITYNFNEHDDITKKLQRLNPDSINYYKYDYNLYKNGVEYYSSWYLTQLTDANGNAIGLTYADDNNTGQTAQELNLYVPTVSTATAKTYQYTITETSSRKHLASIYNSATTVNFNYITSGYTNKSFLSDITWAGLKCVFGYTNLNYKFEGGQYDRYMLGNLSVNDAVTCKVFANYKFDYIGGTSTVLPDSTSKKIDYWGYFNNSTDSTTLLPKILVNPSNSGYNRYQISTDSLSRSAYSVTLSGSMRKANPATVMTASLSRIYYDDNAKTTLEYESNDYYDPSAAGVVKGGGIRIKKITDYDGLDSTKNMVRTYTYTNPATGTSSGKPISLPTFALTIPYSGGGTTEEEWSQSTIRSEDDLSDEDHSILYSYVRETRPGGGSTLYQYSNPATYWDSSSGDWVPTVDYFGRSSTCFSVGFAANGKYLYPFAPNSNYDFERGLLSKVTNYNGSTKVSATSYTYARTASGTPNIIYGLRFTADKDSSFRDYAKYRIYTDVNNLVSVQKDTIYDISATTQYHPSSTNYYYASSYHKLLTSQVMTNSDGRVATTFYKYVKDYTPTASADSTVNALYHLLVRNINIPIEQYVQVDRGGTVTTTSASVSKYKMFALGADSALVLPATMYSLNNAAGVSSFTPAATSGGTFNIDSRYIPKMYNTIYDTKGYLQTAYNNRRQAQTIITDQFYKQPLAVFANAAANQIGYSNFNKAGFPTSTDFTQSGSASTTSTDTRVGPYSLSLQTGTVLNRSLKKGALAANSIFSAWIKSGSSGSFTIKIVHGTDSASRTYSYDSPAGKWVYVSYKVPLTGVTTDYTVRITCDHVILIDDVLFYPENAEVGTSEYDPAKFFKLAQTNTNGKAGYFDYDNAGRITYGYDQDKNIILRKTYVRTDVVPVVLPQPVFTVSKNKNVYVDESLVFTALTSDCTPFVGLNYSWSFGDGGTSTLTEPHHSYTTSGTYNVILTVSADGYSAVKSDTTKITVVISPVFITLSNIATPGTANVTVIRFLQGGVTKYSFSGIELNDMQVVAGTYDIIVGVNGDQYDPMTGDGYGSVNIILDSVKTCLPWFHTHSYRFNSVDLTTPGSRLEINVDIADCP